MVSRTLKYYYLKIIRQHGTPDDISYGMALGVFIGLITPPGPQMVIAFIIASIIKFNRITAVLGVWVSNPFTIPFIYPVQIWIGSLIFHIPLDYKIPRNMDEFWLIFTDISTYGALLISLVAGAIITSIIFSFISFYITRSLVVRYRRNREKRLHLKRLKKTILQVE